MPYKLDVSGVRMALNDHPEYWNEYTFRTESPESPHHGLDDIWARYTPLDKMREDFPCEWYPCADALKVKPVVDALYEHLRWQELGGVLITRIPAGKECKPHTDGGWHAAKFEKFGVSIQAAPGQLFCFDGEWLGTLPGDVFRFENQHRHWVTNPTPEDRITMIVCVRR